MKEKSLLFTLILMFICTGASVSLTPDTVQATISDHVSFIEIFTVYDYNEPNQTNDDEYEFEFCFFTLI